MADEVRICEVHRADARPAQFVFRHPNGAENYLCHVHVAAYEDANPDAVKTQFAEVTN